MGVMKEVLFMNPLFLKYKNSGKITEALLVGRNMVNKNPGDDEGVSEYVDLLLSLAEKLPSLNERKTFVGQANVTLSFYEENAELTPEVIEKIAEYRNRLGAIAVTIDNEENAKANDGLRQIQTENGRLIKELFSIKQKISNAKKKEEFDKSLQDISLIDSKIEHDYLTDDQKALYDQLNRECSDIISSKMRELEHISNVEYNKKAVAAYDSAFKKFKNDEGKYKNQTQLFELVSSTLFAFDAGRLFNETLIYYNHVYSYIFGKLDDDGKLAITRFSIECERKMRS
jgi:hypothetical protein